MPLIQPFNMKLTGIVGPEAVFLIENKFYIWQRPTFQLVCEFGISKNLECHIVLDRMITRIYVTFFVDLVEGGCKYIYLPYFLDFFGIL